MDTWIDRMNAEMAAQRLTSAELERRAFGSGNGGRVRAWRHERTRLPRHPEDLPKLARALGVEPLWLEHGVEPKAAGSMAETAPEISGDEILMRRAFAVRVAEGRRRRRLSSPEEAAIGLVVSPARWRAIEAGATAPTLVELRAIAERLNESLDWLVSGARP